MPTAGDKRKRMIGPCPRHPGTPAGFTMGCIPGARVSIIGRDGRFLLAILHHSP